MSRCGPYGWLVSVWIIAGLVNQKQQVKFTARRLPILKEVLRTLHAAEGHYPILMPESKYPGFLVIVHARPILPFLVSLHFEGLQHCRVVNWSQKPYELFPNSEKKKLDAPVKQSSTPRRSSESHNTVPITYSFSLSSSEGSLGGSSSGTI